MEVSIDYSLLIAVFWDAEDFDDAVRRRRGRLTAHQLDTYPSTLRQQPLSWPKCVGSVPFSFGDSPVRVESTAQKRLNHCLTASTTSVRGSETDVFRRISERGGIVDRSI